MSQKLGKTEPEEKKEKGSDPFWQEYYPYLKRYCHFLTQNTWDGDDIAQETYLKALKYSHHQQKISSALLNKIAYHHWIDIVRKRKNETLMEDGYEDGRFSEHQSENIADAVDLLLLCFTPKQAVIFLLKEAFQYQLKEIAELLEMTEVAVKSNLHRAKSRLEKEKRETPSVKLFWEEEEREKLAELFFEALENQDPSVLIEAIPALTSKTNTPNLVLTAAPNQNIHSIRTFSPSSTLCMAA